jgi:hypothetical protein
LKELAEAEAKDGRGAALPIVKLSDLYLFAFDSIEDRARAHVSVYVSARRGILALERRGLVQIGRPRFDVYQNATPFMTVATVYLRPRRGQRWIKGVSRMLLAARLTPAGRAHLDGIATK